LIEEKAYSRLLYNLALCDIREVLQRLRQLLTPTDLPIEEQSRTIFRLFTGFGPQWVTISRITGLSTTIIIGGMATMFNQNVSSDLDGVWLDIHQKMIDDNENVPCKADGGERSVRHQRINNMVHTNIFRDDNISMIGKQWHR